MKTIFDNPWFRNITSIIAIVGATWILIESRGNNIWATQSSVRTIEDEVHEIEMQVKSVEQSLSSKQSLIDLFVPRGEHDLAIQNIESDVEELKTLQRAFQTEQRAANAELLREIRDK